MALINGRVPYWFRLPRLRSTVVVQVRVRPDAPQSDIDAAARTIGASVGHRLRPYFSPPRYPAMAARQQRFRPYVAFDVLRLFAGSLAARLRSRTDVVTAYEAAGPCPPPSLPDEQLVQLEQQHFLNDAPTGIGARWAWANAMGAPVGFVDVEQGWGLEHKDFANDVTLISGDNLGYRGHGSAALGIVVAASNDFGGKGVGFDANPKRVISEFRPGHNLAEAIRAAAELMHRGDVMLVEAQLMYAGSLTNMPVETEAAVAEAMRFARCQGVVVVEPAGNGGADLDEFVAHDGSKPFVRGAWTAGSLEDSGAIMVAAAGKTRPYVRLDLSNLGSRVDCFAWGEGIETCGDGWDGDGRGYTDHFGGTSGASAIVAGAAVRLQAWAKGNGGVLSTDDVRSRLSDPTLNTNSFGGLADRIGVMPDLKTIIAGPVIVAPPPIITGQPP